MDVLPDIHKQLHVALAQREAFRLFLNLNRWWPLLTHSCSQDKTSKLQVDERVGGLVEEVTADGTRHVWGTITEWDPPRSFSMTWHAGRSPKEATLLRVAFQAQGTGTEVALTHAGWQVHGEGAPPIHAGYAKGWDDVLQNYVNATSQNR